MERKGKRKGGEGPLSPPLPILAKETMCLPCIVNCVKRLMGRFYIGPDIS